MIYATRSMFYVGQAMWDDIKNFLKFMGQLINFQKYMGQWQSEYFKDWWLIKLLMFKSSLHLS